MNIVRSAITRSLLAGISGCGGTVAAAPSVTSAAASTSCDAPHKSSTMSATPTTDATNTASHAETYGPWSDGMSDTAPNRFLQTKGVRFAYRAFGRKPGVPVVFLAPLGRNMDFWDPKLTDALAQGHLVLLFDNVGVGLSSGESPKTIAETAKDVGTFIDALKELHFTDSDWTNGRIDLLGLSFGGFVAQQLALDRPDLVERVVLAGTAPQGGEDVGTRSPEVAKRETASPPIADDVLRLLFAQTETSQRAGRAFIARTDGRPKDRDAPVASKTIAAQASALKDWGGTPKSGYSYLAGLKQPVLVADGVADVVFPVRNSIVLAQALPNAQLMVYPDSGAGFLFQFPDQFASHVSVFLQRP